MARKKVIKKKKERKVMLLDAEGMVYALCTSKDFLKEERNDLDEYWEVLNGAGVKEELDIRIDNMLGILGCETVIMAFGSRSNFRKRLSPEYKKQRRNKKPLGYWAIVDWCKENYTTMEYPELEADDVLGILATGQDDFLDGMRPVIVSNDKDMRTVPGLHFRWDDEKMLKPDNVSRADAAAFKAVQALTGDAVDGYSGCPGIGMVKASKLVDAALLGLQEFPEDVDSFLFNNVVLPQYLAKEMTKKDALLQARLARILQRQDIEIKEDGSWKILKWNP